MRAPGFTPVLLLLGGCAGYVALTPYDPEVILARHPGLKGRIARSGPSMEGPGVSEERWLNDREYRLRPGDTLRITVQDDMRRVMVLQDEQIELLGERISTANRTLGQLADAIRVAAARRYVQPRVAVAVLAPPVVRVRVCGCVRSPGLQESDREVSVEFAVARAGTMRQGACPNQVLVIRSGRVIVCDLVAFRERGDVFENLMLQDGDVVVVPKISEGDLLAEWGPVERFATGAIDEEAFAREIERCQR